MREDLPDVIEAWIEETLKDPKTGLPPTPLKLDLDFPLGPGILIGDYEGSGGPKSGTRFQTVELRLSFPDATSDQMVAQTAETIVRALAEDPTLGGVLHPGRLIYREHSVKPDAGSYGAQSVLMSIHTSLSTPEPG